MGDWKDKLKDAWNQYGSDIIAGGAGAVGGWFLPHLFWDKPSYVNKGASAALLAAISIAGSRGIKDALKDGAVVKAPQKYTTQAASFLGGLLNDGGKDYTEEEVQKAGQIAKSYGKRVADSVGFWPMAGAAGAGYVSGAVGYTGLRDAGRGLKMLGYKAKLPKWLGGGNLSSKGWFGTPGKSRSVPHPHRAGAVMAVLSALTQPFVAAAFKGESNNK